MNCLRNTNSKRRHNSGKRKSDICLAFGLQKIPFFFFTGGRRKNSFNEFDEKISNDTLVNLKERKKIALATKDVVINIICSFSAFQAS